MDESKEGLANPASPGTMTSNNESKSDKLKLEEQKLSLEIQELKKPFYKRPGIWTSTITLALAIAGVFTQGVLSDLDNKRTLLIAEQKTAEADKREAEANLASQEAKNRVAEAEERTKSLLWEARRLEIDQTALKSTIVSTRAELDALLETVDRIRTSGTQMTAAELSAIQAELKGTRDALRVCSDSQRNASNTALELSAFDENAAIEWHAPWGLPEAEESQRDNQQLFQVWWITGYSKIGKIPLWTIHRLDARAGEDRQRVDCWRPDPRIPGEFTASLSDYAGSGFDRGHLVSRADVDFSEVAQTSSFILSNGTPQVPELNRIVWGALEKIARERKSSGQNEIFVISGSIFDYDADGIADATIGTQTIGANKVSIPSHFYKIILETEDSIDFRVISFLVPNEESNLSPADRNRLDGFVTDIASLERLSGFRLLPGLQTEQISEIASSNRFQFGDDF